MFRQSFYSKFCFCLFLGLTWVVGSGQIISQYVETDSGTSPKGIEIWNNTSTSIDFSVDNLFIEKGTNGAEPSLDFTIDSGVLQPNEVLIVGTVDMQPAAATNSVLFFEKSFTFNGDDALVLKLGSTVTDVFGMPNSDPGNSWEVNGVDTRNQNIALLSGITTGELVGFSDPSARFETINTTPSDIANGGLDGFGEAPIPVGPILSVSAATINGLNYIEGDGPSNSQSFEISGSNLDGTDVSINAPVNFAISDSQTGTYGNAVTLNNFDGSATNIWVRLVSGLSFGSYSGDISINGGGASPAIVSLNGNVTGEVIVQQDFDSSTPIWNYTNDIPFFDDGWGTAFYGIISFATVSSELDNSNFNGNLLGENDLQSPNGTSGVATISFENINISGYTNVQLSFDYQFVNYNANDDQGSYEIFENEIGQGLVFIADGNFTALENTSGSESFSVTSGTNEISLDYMLENNGATGYSGLDNLILTGLANDTDTDINTPATQVASGNIIVDEALSISTSVPVFKFDVEDLGGDGFDTELTHVRVIPGPNNTADWSDVIEGIRLEGDGNNVSETDQNLSILDDELIIEVTTNNGEMTIAEGTSKEYTISVFIDPNFAVEGEIIQMAIDDSNDHFFVNPAGSMVSRNIMGFEGNEHSIEIEGNKLEFIVNPATTIVNEPMGTVQVAYTDGEGRIDTDFTAQVSISSSGVLSGDPVILNAVDGVASFSTLTHTALGSNLALTASSVGETDIVSSNFNIIALPELFITEVADPDISGGDGKFVEIYNAGITPINFDDEDYFLVRESNGGGALDFIPLVGTIEPKGYYTIGEQANFNTQYGFEPSHNDNFNTATVSGNGNDSYFISRDDLNDTALKNSRIDIYGVLGVDGIGQNWEYTNGRAYRNNPIVKNSNTTFDITEWSIEAYSTNNGLQASDMTPGYGDNDYIYDGAWTNIGLGNPNTTTSTTAQNIFVRSGTAILTQDTSIGDLVVRSGATLELEPNVKLTVTGDIVNEGTIIFESNDTSTAVLEAVQPNTRVVGNGFEVQRRIPVQDGFRAFRYLSSSVDTQNSAKPFVFDNWQEGGNTPNGFGTHITGAMGTIGDISPDGFDSTSTGNASMYIYDPTLGLPWQSIPNTNATNFSVGDAYAILIRGDRNSPLNTNDQTGPSTTLRTTGKIHVGDFEVPNLSDTDGHFNLVGNPYQSQVDLSDLLSSSNQNSQGLDEQFIYMWDPTIGSLGGYATVDLSDGSNDAGTVPGTSDANQFLQPQQAFFLETTGSNPTLTFTEDTKNNSDPQTTVFSTDTERPAQLNITLKTLDGKTYDGLRIVYDDIYNNAIDNYDATKFWNYTDNLSILSNENYISIEKRSIPSTGEVTPLYFGSQSLASYAFEIELSPNEEFDVYLVDQYTEQTIAIPEDTVLNYSFSVDANIPESIANDRFELTYENTSLNTKDVTSLNFSIYPNPLESGESLYIRSSGEIISKITSIELLNLNGQVLEVFQQSTLEPENNLTKINFKSRPVIGTYLLKITTNQNVIINKIIIK